MPLPVSRFASALALRESFSASVVHLPRYETRWTFVQTSMDKRLPSFQFGRHSVTRVEKLNTKSPKHGGWGLEKCRGCTGCEPTRSGTHMSHCPNPRA